MRLSSYYFPDLAIAYIYFINYHNLYIKCLLVVYISVVFLRKTTEIFINILKKTYFFLKISDISYK